MGETLIGASDSHYHDLDMRGKRIIEEEESGDEEEVSENEADTGVESAPEEDDYGTPTGSAGVQGATVRPGTTASPEDPVVFLKDASVVEEGPEGPGGGHPISPFTLAEEPSHAPSWKNEPYPGWTRVTSIMVSGACQSVAPVTMAPGVPIEES